ncbi:MAG: lipase family protein [Oleispira sp.]|nr:lipase family protein [Oleispira sp.]
MLMSRLLIVILLVLCSPVFAAVDFSAIKKSALISAASYADYKLIEERLSRIELSLVHHNVLPDSALSYFLARTSSGLQYLSFRGTSNLENALVDLNLSLQLDASLNIQLHQGFAIAAKAAYEDVKSKLDKSQPIITTGHSLGGAIAVIMAMHLQRDGYQLDQVITFGQPKVTNVSGADVFASLPLIRVVTPKDIVPLVPPLSPLQLQNIDIYWHIGKEIILLAENEYAITEGFKSMMRATKFVSSVPDESNVHAHQMSTYLTLIDQKREGAQQVPYKMEINLFGFSLE